MDDLETILAKFGKKETGTLHDKTTQKPEGTTDKCGKCSSDQLWLPKRSEQWRCQHCQPPISESMVAERMGKVLDAYKAIERPRHIVFRGIFVYADQRCRECHGAWIVEKSWSDGSTQSACWTCGQRHDG